MYYVFLNTFMFYNIFLKQIIFKITDDDQFNQDHTAFIAIDDVSLLNGTCPNQSKVSLII